MDLALFATLGVIVALIIIWLFFSSIRVVQQYERGVIFVLGRLTGAKGPGVFFCTTLYLADYQS